MIRAIALLAACTGCGRLRFDENSRADAALDAPTDRLTATHDEDGDGLPDVIDKCPQIAGTNADMDGDGVGDACDPNPSVATEHFLRFATMQAGDSPFDDAGWTQKDDSWFASLSASSPTSNSLYIGQTVGTVRIDLRFAITAINGIATDQHQVAIGVERPTPYYFAELNDNGGTSDVAVYSYDAVNGYVAHGTTTGALLHAGTGLLRIDANATTQTWAIEAGWTGELYTANGPTTSYDGGTGIRLAVNNVDIEITSITLVETQ